MGGCHSRSLWLFHSLSVRLCVSSIFIFTLVLVFGRFCSYSCWLLLCFGFGLVLGWVSTIFHISSWTRIKQRETWFAKRITTIFLTAFCSFKFVIWKFIMDFLYFTSPLLAFAFCLLFMYFFVLFFAHSYVILNGNFREEEIVKRKGETKFFYLLALFIQ